LTASKKKMTDWINNKFGLQLSNNDLTNVKDFSLIWNIYDNLVFESSFSIENAENIYQEIEIGENEINEILEYFKSRYVKNGETNHRFNHLNFRTNDRMEFVRDVLSGNINDIKNKALAITIIVYRFRNNLFHGIKDFRIIDQQNDNFHNANQFLQIMINKFQ
tara:strand:+ start:27 stop:515 length:489 start_codon:yes stop_codon:yes gene_type:complete